MRARLARSARPGRIFEVTLDVAKKSGLVGSKRVVDSTPIYDAAAAMDTVTLVRSAIRGLLREVGPELEADLRGRLSRDDDYAAAGKPDCAWDDQGAREALVDALARDAVAVLGALEGRAVSLEAAEAAAWARRGPATSSTAPTTPSFSITLQAAARSPNARCLARAGMRVAPATAAAMSAAAPRYACSTIRGLPSTRAEVAR
jgi:hypothetical protein